VLRARGEEEVGTKEEGISCDVREFETALEAGQAEQALELYRGSLFNGFHVSEVPEFERWLDEERERVRRRACEGAQLLIERDETARNPVGAARWAQRLTELSPFDETAVRPLVELLDHAAAEEARGVALCQPRTRGRSILHGRRHRGDYRTVVRHRRLACHCEHQRQSLQAQLERDS